MLIFPMMENLQFQWDPYKAKTNLKKHGISFDEATSVFYDEFAIEFYDDEHSAWENRFLILGLSSKSRLLIVCHCYRDSEAVIRIISARKATKDESRYYPDRR